MNTWHCVTQTNSNTVQSSPPVSCSHDANIMCRLGRSRRGRYQDVGGSEEGGGRRERRKRAQGMPEGAGGEVEGDRDVHARGLGESKCKEARMNLNSSDQ